MSTAAPIKQQGQGYEMARPQGKCVVCGRVIEPDEKYMAALRETPAGFERLDVGLECWEQLDRANLLGFWQTHMPRAEQKKKVFVDDEVLCNLFERLADAAEPGKISFRFVLGLILIRKRLLVYESSRRDGDNDLWVVRFRGREGLLDLLDPKLTETQMMEVSQQLGEILNEEL
ncbi:MAG TPA: hypothetical protein VIL86_16395 [Tepidisphaeraceae bacterium]